MTFNNIICKFKIKNMISKIYNSDIRLFKVGSRKGKTREQIEGTINKFNKNRKKTKSFINKQNKKFKFGKYKDELVKDVPKNYINWCINNLELYNWELRYLQSIKKSK